jgi:hypothetical protein
MVLKKLKELFKQKKSLIKLIMRILKLLLNSNYAFAVTASLSIFQLNQLTLFQDQLL